MTVSRLFTSLVRPVLVASALLLAPVVASPALAQHTPAAASARAERSESRGRALSYRESFTAGHRLARHRERMAADVGRMRAVLRPDQQLRLDAQRAERGGRIGPRAARVR